MMKLFFMVSLTLLYVGATAADKKPSAKNPNVAYTAHLKPGKLKAGADGELLLTLTPNKGIHINLEPPLSVMLDSSAAIASIGTADIPKKDTVLDVSKPIRLPFSLSKKIKPGNVTFTGTVTYFYCSETENWCSKFKQPFEVKLTVVK